MARPSKLTPEVQTLVVEMLQAGNFIETAAAAAGIDRDTIRQWLKRGARAKSGKFRRFRDEVVKAMAESEAGLIALVGNAAIGGDGVRGQWQAAAWLLERKFPEKYARRQKIEAKVTQIRDPFEGRSPEELAFYADNGYFPDEAPDDGGGPDGQKGNDGG